jgi:excisionase family DNA binding protein
MIAEQYMRPLEAAAYLRTSISTLAKARVLGGGPTFTRIGRAVRYRKSDLDEYMAARLATSTSQALAVRRTANPRVSR